MDARTNALFQWAKRSAIAARRDRLAVEDVLCGVYAMAHDGLMTQELTFLKGDGHIEWPEQVLALYDSALHVPAEDATARKFGFDSTLAAVVASAQSGDAQLEPGSLVRQLQPGIHPIVRDWYKRNGHDGSAVKVETRPEPEQAPVFAAPGAPPALDVVTLAARLDAILGQMEALVARLNTRVLGQANAVSMLGHAYFQACVAQGGQGPRGIFTFLGPPGVGKTLLAESFAAALQEAEQGEYGFRRFDMGSFAGPQSFEQLFGAEQFYKGSRPGTLTGFVKEHPKSVLLFDEIEKAHESTIQALLSVLDKGEVVDKALEKSVAFREAWLVFTTNLGREFFGADNESGVLRDAALAPSAVFDLLSSARTRRDVGAETAQPALSPEFVSRLAKGGAVVFNRLHAGHYLELLDASLTPEPAIGVTLPEIRADHDARLVFLLSLLPDLDARRVASAGAAWGAEIIRRSFEQCRDEICGAGLDRLALDLTVGPGARTFLAAQYADVDRPRLVLIDDDDHLPAVIERGCAAFRPLVTHVRPGEDILGRLKDVRADLVLLDLSINEGAASSRVEAALEILGTLRSSVPALPVYLFSENPGGRAAFDAVVARVMRQGGAKGFLACQHRPDGDPFEAFEARLCEVLAEVRHSAVIHRLGRARKRVSFQVGYRWDPAGPRLVGELDGLREEVVVNASDRAAAVTFAGIPLERFDDVAGLERAKRRLRQVHRWLSNPGTLGAYGVPPPTGFLLAGQPGTGKTLLARALAGEAGLPFLAFTASEIQSKWAGESEQRIRDVFDRARRYAPAIVFIDEIDAIASARREDTADWRASVVNQLLASMDGFKAGDGPVFVLAATNHPEALDPALTRPGRFDEIIPIDPPNAAARRQFFERRFHGIRAAPEVDLDGLVRTTAGCTPALLDRIVREAVYGAAADGRAEISGADLAAASRAVRFGANREVAEIDPEERRQTAYHEAGHAVVHRLLFPERRIEYLTIVPNESGALGFLAPESDERRRSISVADVRKEIAVCLAGREAERAASGRDDAVTGGASSDLRRATKLAHAAVAEWAFDAEFGLVVPAALPAIHSALGDRLEQRLACWLEEGRRTAVELLERHRTALDALAGALLEKESLDGDAVEAVAGGVELFLRPV